MNRWSFRKRAEVPREGLAISTDKNLKSCSTNGSDNVTEEKDPDVTIDLQSSESGLGFREIVNIQKKESGAGFCEVVNFEGEQGGNATQRGEGDRQDGDVITDSVPLEKNELRESKQHDFEKKQEEEEKECVETKSMEPEFSTKDAVKILLSDSAVAVENEDQLPGNRKRLVVDVNTKEEQVVLKAELTADERLVDYIAILEHEHESGAGEVKVVFREPQVEHIDSSWPSHIGMFCAPQEELTEKDQTHTFVLTDTNGLHTFGACVSLGIKRSLLILTRWPFFQLLQQLLRLFRDEVFRTFSHNLPDTHMLVRKFISQTAIPPPGSLLRLIVKTSVQDMTPTPGILPSVRGLDHYNKQILHLDCYRPAENTLPFIDDSCLATLFSCLCPEHVVTIVNGMLLDQRILLHSNDTTKLTLCTEALCSLMFPFRWSHIYIPYLPTSLIGYLDSPWPFIIGVKTSALVEDLSCEALATCFIVHLDLNKVVSPIDIVLSTTNQLSQHSEQDTLKQPLPELPFDIEKDLLTQLEQGLLLAQQQNVSVIYSSDENNEKHSSTDENADKSFSEELDDVESNPKMELEDISLNEDEQPDETRNMCSCFDGNHTNAHVDGSRLSNKHFNSSQMRNLKVVYPHFLVDHLQKHTTCICPHNARVDHAKGEVIHSIACLSGMYKLRAAENLFSSRPNMTAGYVLHERQGLLSDQIVITFSSGSLPFVLSPYHSELESWNVSVVVSASDDNAVVPQGALLVAVNDLPTLNLSFGQTVTAIRAAKRPVTMRFMSANSLPKAQPAHRWCDMVRTAFLSSIIRLVGNVTKFFTYGSRRAYLTRFITQFSKLSLTLSHFKFDSYLRSIPNDNKEYVRALLNTQGFSTLVDDFVSLKQASTAAQGTQEIADIELFQRCICLYNSLPQPLQKSELFPLILRRMIGRSLAFPVIELESQIELSVSGTPNCSSARLSRFTKSSEAPKALSGRKPLRRYSTGKVKAKNKLTIGY